MSPRRASAFVRINCAAISEPLLEAELFGNETSKQAGPDRAGRRRHRVPDRCRPSSRRRCSRSEAAARPRGWLSSPHGTRAARTIDVRFIASTSQRPAAEVDAGRFRRDLYFRLAGATFTIPSLRERKDEVLPLAEQFVASAAGPLGKLVPDRRRGQAVAAVHDWPGNIRELRNACERAVLLATGAVIELHHLTTVENLNASAARASSGSARRRRSRRRWASSRRPPPTCRARSAPRSPSSRSSASSRRSTSCAGNQTRAAEMLGISRRTLINRLDEYGIARPRKRDE